jgi:hypothetical protein
MFYCLRLMRRRDICNRVIVCYMSEPPLKNTIIEGVYM